MSRVRNRPKTKALTVGDVTRICDVSAKSVQDWCDDEQIDGVYRLPCMGKHQQGDRRIPVESLRAFMSRIGMPLKWLDEYVSRGN